MSVSPDELLSSIEHAMQADRFRLRFLASRITRARHDGQPHAKWFDEFQERLTRSRELAERRLRQRPGIVYDDHLPITARRDEIIAAVSQHPVVVVCGDTGSGKSTQLPKMCLEMGRGIRGLIGHTQPRRIAARSVAARLAEELQSTVGQAVGFKIRFTDSTSPQTYIKLMTDGILLAETQGDRFLDQYDTLIIDEAHERSLNIDFLIGYVKRLLPRRPDLRVIITSATIDAERFSAHFESEQGPAPVIQVAGRTYPVEVWYRPPAAAADDDEPDRQQAVLDGIEELLRHDRHGDILVFLATEREILELTKSLRGRLLHSGGGCEVLPLYARLSAKEQNRVFEAHTKRRIVLATNVAESSLTVPGIRYVVDEGTARISRYAARSKIQRLPIEPVSQASADQRKGRCGRLGPGICVRLYDQADYETRERFTPPEIRRSNLAAVILRAEALQLGQLDAFPFLDPPQSNLIRDGYATLYELGAVDADNRLTDIGRKLSRLPTDPRIGRIILGGIAEGCLREILIIAAALEVQDPRERPADKRQAADEAHARWADPESDFLSYLWLWNFYHDLKEKLSRNQLKKACHQNFISPTRMHEWLEVYRQLRQLVDEYLPAAERGVRSRWVVDEVAVSPHPPEADSPRPSEEPDRRQRREREQLYGRVHRALLAGLLSNIALKTEVHEYTGAGNIRLQLWPGSACFARKPKWIVAAELVETTRRYARCAAPIQPAWIEPLAGHLLNRSYSDPYWNGPSGSAMAFEKTTLFGLTITARRPAPYGAVDPAHAREMFIRHGLIEGELPASAPFLDHNRQLRQVTERLVAKTRRTDLVADDFAIYGFYHKRLPGDVYDWARLNRWRRDAERADPRRLFMTPADMTAATELPEEQAFPDQLPSDRVRVPLEYHFEPGADHDGITVVVPQAGLGQLAPARLEWLVPGMVADKVEALIRSLPKNLRRGLIPVAETAQRAARELPFGEGEFLTSVARLLSRLAGERISPDAFDLTKIPPHLRMNVRVVDDQGQPVRSGRDLIELREQLGTSPLGSEPSPATATWHRDGITRWDFGTLPAAIEVRRGDMTLQGYPGLVDQGTSASLRLFDAPEQAAASSRGGVRRLFVLSEQRALKAHVAWLPDLAQLTLYAAGLMTSAEFQSDILALLADRAFLDDTTLPRSAEEFQSRLVRGRDEIEGAVQDVARLIGPLFKTYHAVRLAIENASSLAGYALDDVRHQLLGLFVKNFLVAVPWVWLQHFPRYLEAIRLRLQKLTQGGMSRDRQAFTELVPRLERYQQRRDEHQRRGVVDPELERYRWMLEELRVSLFAQQLGTSEPISPKRLDKQWEKVV